MPSITYIEEDNQNNGSERPARDGGPTSPEPPSRYNGDSKFAMQPPSPEESTGRPDFGAVRRLITVSQVMAITSLLIGGVILSTAALVTAIVALRRATGAHTAASADEMPWRLLRRSATIAVVVSILALIANAIALAVIYPMVINALETGDYSSLIPGTTQTAPSNPNTSTWG